MKKLFIVMGLLFVTNTTQATPNYYIECYKPPGQKHLYIHEQETGGHRLFLNKIKTISNRDQLSVYFNNKNILVFKSEHSKKQVIDCWNKHYKNLERKTNNLSSLGTIIRGVFLDKLGNGWR